MDINTLNISEQQIVIQTLESVLADLRMEILHTDKKEYREVLKHRKTVIVKAINLLKDERK